MCIKSATVSSIIHSYPTEKGNEVLERKGEQTHEQGARILHAGLEVDKGGMRGGGEREGAEKGQARECETQRGESAR